VEGYVDGITLAGDRYYLKGWACVRASTNSIPVHVYADGPAGSGILVLGATANLLSEPIIGEICGSGSQSHRYSIDITVLRGQYSNRRLFVHGLNLADPNRNYYLRGSGLCMVP
ncbi:MAG: hypothetical protein ABL958_19650, partial [Bdellovibrionia bacterium]